MYLEFENGNLECLGNPRALWRNRFPNACKPARCAQHCFSYIRCPSIFNCSTGERQLWTSQPWALDVPYTLCLPFLVHETNLTSSRRCVDAHTSCSAWVGVATTIFTWRAVCGTSCLQCVAASPVSCHWLSFYPEALLPSFT